MKTALATIVALGLLAGTANAQYVSHRHVGYGHGYSSGPAYCPPGVTFRQTTAVVAPRVAVAQPAAQPTVAAAPAAAAEPAATEAAPEQQEEPQGDAPAAQAPAAPQQ